MRVRALIGVLVVGAGLGVWAGVLGLELRQPLRLLLPRSWLLVVIGALAAVSLCSRAAWTAWRRRETPGLCWRALAYVVVAAWAVEAFVWKRAQLHLDVWTIAAASGVHAAVCLLAWSSFARRSRWLRAADMVAMNALVFLLLGEAGIRVVAAVRPAPLFMAPGTTELDFIAANRATPGRRRLDIPINARGYFDQEFLPRERRTRPMVLAIGDSFSTGVVPHSAHYTTVAENELGGVDVYNLGVSAIGPREYLYLWQNEGRSLQPDLLVVALFVGNDLSDGAVEAKPLEWRDPQSSLLCRTLYRSWLVFDETRRMKARARGNDGIDDSTGAAEESSFDEPAWIDDPRLEPPTFSTERFFGIERGRALSICRPGSSERFNRFFACLQRLIDAAGETPLVFVLIPDEFQVEDPLWEEILKTCSDRLHRDLPQQRILAWLAPRGVPCLDLLPALRSLPVEADGLRHAYHLQDTHFNARGNRRAGEALATFLRPLLEAQRAR